MTAVTPHLRRLLHHSGIAAAAAILSVMPAAPSLAAMPSTAALCEDGEKSCPAPAGPAALPSQGQGRGDQFGLAVAASGEWLAVGAPRDGRAAARGGAVYIFRRDKDGWSQAARLAAASPSADALFGSSLSWRDGGLLVGAPGEKAGNLSNAGAAYIFERQPDGRWRQQARLTAPQPAAGDYFASAVTWSGPLAVAGAHLRDDGDADTGAAYVFAAGSGGWAMRQQLVTPGLASGSLFGNAVAADGGVIAVGAYGHDGATPGGGGVFVFEAGGDGMFTLAASLSAEKNKAFTEFGWSVALRGDRMAVGAPYEDDGPQRGGVAYLFHRQDGKWRRQAVLRNTDEAWHGRFGASVALGEDLLVVGSPVGVAYAFRAQGQEWRRAARLALGRISGDSLFNHTIAATGGQVILGLPAYKGSDRGQAAAFTLP